MLQFQRDPNDPNWYTFARGSVPSWER